MEIDNENILCLFCLNKILPYSICITNSSGEVEGLSSSISLIIPNFQVICNYLQLKSPMQCFRTSRGENDDKPDCGGQSIFKASCDKFLCLNCFESVNNLRMMHKELEDIKERIKVITKSIKNVILAHSVITVSATSVSEGGSTGGGLLALQTEVVGNFAKAFESHVKLVTESSSFWKGEGNIMDAFMEIKQEIEEYVVMEVEQADDEFIGSSEPSTVVIDEVRKEDDSREKLVCISEDESGNDLSLTTVTTEGNLQNKEILAKATKQLQEIAGKICSKEDNSQEEAEAGTGAKVHRKRVFECSHCSKCCTSIRSLEVHIAKTHSDVKKKKGKGNSGKKDSLRIKTEIEVDGKKLFCCPYCKKYYDKVKALRNHIARNHAPGCKSAPVVTCSLCNTYKAFKTEELLEKHIFSFHTPGSKFKCELCNKKFYSKQYLNNHIDTEHKGIRYHCPQCPKFYSHPTQLKHHLRTIHFKEGLLKCLHCTREFARHCDLEGHMLSHDPNAKRDYVCDVCGKEFLTRPGLSDHMIVHEERRHQCTYCPDKFKKRSHLVGHMRKHTGEKPFSCTLCERAFAVRSTLTQHMKVHEGPPKKRGKKPKMKSGPLLEEGDVTNAAAESGPILVNAS